ncbi:MAG: hypothetical protein KAQ75_05335 [Bacteroidales bacterium]|nr:hypothetical protein [Bacteroidales bacterium]
MRTKTISLFPQTEKPIFRAYMSSALTGFNGKTEEEETELRKQVTDLNVLIKKECEKNGVQLYLPQESSNPASSHDDGLNPEEVYLLDRWRIAESDFMILNADNLSFGVGQEMEIANAMAIPTIMFYKKGKKVSRMLLGAPCVFVPLGYDKDSSFIIYEEHDDLISKIIDRIHELKASINPKSERDIHSESFSKKLKDIRERNNFSFEVLSERTGLTVSFLQLLETEKHYFDQLAIDKNLNNKTFDDIDSIKFANPGLWVIEKLKIGLKIDLDELIPITPNVQSFDQIDIYREAITEMNLSLPQLFQVNKKLGIEFSSFAAKDRPKTKEDIIKFIQNEIS